MTTKADAEPVVHVLEPGDPLHSAMVDLNELLLRWQATGITGAGAIMLMINACGHVAHGLRSRGIMPAADVQDMLTEANRMLCRVADVGIKTYPTDTPAGHA